MSPAPDARAVRRRQSALGGVLLLAAVVAGALALRPAEAASPSTAPSARSEVALWSARRLPAALASVAGGLRAPAEVEEALGTTDSCFLLEVGGRRLVADDVDTSLVPASTQKLLTGAAALAVLGPGHRFTTRVVREGDRLYLVGGADPVLMTSAYARFLQEDDLTRGHPSTSIEDLAEAVADAGVEGVDQVVGDASRHEGPLTVPSWKRTYVTSGAVSHLRALTVNGGWAAWDPAKVAAPDPAREAAAVLTRLLRQRGVDVAGEPGVGNAPDGADEVARVSSPPLERIVASMVRESDNTTAELLAREVGVATARQGTTPAGAGAVVDELAELGVDTDGVDLVDGSGLDRGNRATCRAVFAALELARRDPDRFDALERGLAVAGERGTLHDRMEEAPYAGRLRAKTGGLLGVTGLVGAYRGGGEEQPLRFAMVANGAFDTLGGYAVQERVASALDRFPYAFPDPGVLAPGSN